MKKVIIILVCMIVGCIFVQRQQYKKIYSLNKELKIKTDSLKKQVDSLTSEMFVKDIQIGRYEYIMDRAQAEMTPDCKEELETILKQTE
jgi:uncharacterized protein YlbG (UPF0298 family)